MGCCGLYENVEELSNRLCEDKWFECFLNVSCFCFLFLCFFVLFSFIRRLR